MKKGDRGLKGRKPSGISWQTECHLKISKLVNFARFDNSKEGKSMFGTVGQ
jgi:hypothetical protein